MAAVLNTLSDPPNWWTALYRLAVLVVLSLVLLRQTRTLRQTEAAATAAQQCVQVAGARSPTGPAPEGAPPP